LQKTSLTSRKRVIKVQEAYRTSNWQDQKGNTPRHIIIKNTQLKAAIEKRQVAYKGNSIRIRADFSTQTLNAWRSWENIIPAQKESNSQPRLVYQAKLFLLNWRRNENPPQQGKTKRIYDHQAKTTEDT
jgi:hypothetical protein